MELQFAEIEAQHQQFISGKYPDRDNLAKNLGARYLNGPYCASMESLSGTSEVFQGRSARSRTTSDNSHPGPPQWESLHHLPGDSPEGLGTHQKPGRTSSARGHGNKSGTGAAVRGFTREGQPSALKRSQSSMRTDSNADQSSNLHTKAAMAGSSSGNLVSPIGRVASDTPYSKDSTVMSSSHECSPSLLIRPSHSPSNTSVSSPATSQLQSRSRPISLVTATPGRPISLVTTTPGSSDYSSDKSGHRQTAGWSSGGSGSRGRFSNSNPHVFRFRDDSPEAESVTSSAVGETQSVSISMPMRQVPKDRADVIGEVISTPSITGLCTSSAELMRSGSQDKLPDSYSNQSLRSPKGHAHLASHPLLSDSSEADDDRAAVQQQVDVEAHDMMHLRLDHGVKDGATIHGGLQTEGWEDEDMGEEPSLMHLHKTSKESSSAVIKAAPKVLPLGQKHGSDETASPSHGGANVAQYLVPAAFQQQVPPAQAAITTRSSTPSSHHHQADAHAPSAGATATTTITGEDSVLYGSPQVFRSDGSGSRYFLSPAGSNPRSRTAWGTQGQASVYANQAELEVVVGPGSQGSQYEQQFVILPSVGTSAAEQVYNRVSGGDQRGLRTFNFVVPPVSAGPAAYFPEATSLLYSPLRYVGDSDDEDYSISHSSGLHTSSSTSAAAHHHRHHISRRVSAAASIPPSPSTALAPYHLTRGGLEADESTNTTAHTSIERYGISPQDESTNTTAHTSIERYGISPQDESTNTTAHTSIERYGISPPR
ncbi:hypothetical protein CEUSTIGMA_g7124.t1 [Chlamydomonas eustigma]|uniref:Uncharacterized protein n=1 Tax=Chlamydomonas eustigma TaxID=1157962 RepID=A0A250X9C4_9CHLO|nr:hypothetical protein CEUSTIGMA_g7124.t1 [Chlamydomonas eustigma]|eukprot:GAX79683.1 hypothetical protein CEUSTIGMA_g7124.t1 [Chlamydomonas eustigma]